MNESIATISSWIEATFFEKGALQSNVMFLLILLGSLLLAKIIKGILSKIVKHREKTGRSASAVFINSIANSVTSIGIAIGVSIGEIFLRLPPPIMHIAALAIQLFVIYAVARLFYSLVDMVDYWIETATEDTRGKMDEMLLPIVGKSIRIIIIILAAVQMAQAISEKSLTSIIAGLGIGGLAIALAAQDTIKNFFGSIVLFIDKPFKIGDRLVVDGHDGPVEKVGFRSTRLRTLEGHLVTIPNGQLSDKTILNIGQRPNIRKIGNIGITYNTPPEKVRRAKEIIEELLKDHEGMDPELPPRVVFDNFASHYLNIFYIYWYHPPDWWAFQYFNERINFQILEKFNQEGIEFAFPTQTVYLENDNKSG